MSENAIVPYRVTDVSTLQPIDLAIVPNESREEMTRIEMRDAEAGAELMAMRGARAKWAVKHAFSRFFLPLIFLLAAFWGLGFIALADALIMMLLAAVVLPIVAMIAHEIDLPDTEEVRALRQRRETLQRRLSKLKSLDRLTGNSDQARLLLDEAKTFNKDLANLDGETCTRKDVRSIEEKRSAILSRIIDFRGKVVEIPDDRAS